jgi:CRISPR/Cas system CSM-associated protein Csm2 small subunit
MCSVNLAGAYSLSNNNLKKVFDVISLIEDKVQSSKKQVKDELCKILIRLAKHTQKST